MIRIVVVAAASIGLIAFLTFIVGRLARSRTRGLSVRMQIFLALSSIVGAFSFGVGVMVIDRVEARASRLALAAAADEARTVASLIKSELARTDASLERLAAGLDVFRPGEREKGIAPREPAGLELFDRDGKILYPAGGRSRAFEKGAVYVDAAIQSGGERLGVVRVIKPTLVVRALLAEIAPSVLVIVLVLGAAAAIAAAWIGRTIAEPIETLSEFGEQVSEGRRPPLPQSAAGREVARLVRAIDTMRRKLEGRPFVEAFAADLSHELKNPVAALLASAEVLEDGAIDEPVQARRFVQRMREAAERIERLVEELLDLAELETRSLDGRPRVDLAQIARETLSALGEDHARVDALFAGDCTVRGDAAWLGRALTNLLSNALIHSPEEARVRLALGAESGKVIVRVENEGAIARHIRADIFRRFVTTRRQDGGTGLGLSIVRAVAEAHGGQVEVISFGPPRVILELNFPPA